MHHRYQESCHHGVPRNFGKPWVLSCRPVGKPVMLGSITFVYTHRHHHTHDRKYLSSYSLQGACIFIYLSFFLIIFALMQRHMSVHIRKHTTPRHMHSNDLMILCTPGLLPNNLCTGTTSNHIRIERGQPSAAKICGSNKSSGTLRGKQLAACTS